MRSRSTCFRGISAMNPMISLVKHTLWCACVNQRDLFIFAHLQWWRIRVDLMRSRGCYINILDIRMSHSVSSTRLFFLTVPHSLSPGSLYFMVMVVGADVDSSPCLSNFTTLHQCSNEMCISGVWLWHQNTLFSVKLLSAITNFNFILYKRY